MALKLLSGSFGSAYANMALKVTDSATGSPARLYASSSGNAFSKNGQAVLNASGSYSFYVDSRRDYNVAVIAGHGGEVNVGRNQATDDTPSASKVILTGDRTTASTDNASVFYCTTALILTVPADLNPRPDFIVKCPPSGAVTVKTPGAADVTRTRANNPGGFVVSANYESDTYGVSGS